MNRLSAVALGATITILVPSAGHAVSDGTAEGHQKAREACKKEVGPQIQKTASKDEKHMLWYRCMQDHLSTVRK